MSTRTSTKAFSKVAAISESRVNASCRRLQEPHSFPPNCRSTRLFSRLAVLRAAAILSEASARGSKYEPPAALPSVASRRPVSANWTLSLRALPVGDDSDDLPYDNCIDFLSESSEAEGPADQEPFFASRVCDVVV